LTAGAGASPPTYDQDMRRNYWIYSIGLGVVWAVLLIVVFSIRGSAATPFLYVFGGFVIAWISGTIARYVYPPPTRWRRAE
jgi:hypothetical protein